MRSPPPPRAESHPGPGTYIRTAGVLFVITLVEVGVFYVGLAEALLVPILLALSAAKFALVALFYMHLRYDRPLFAGTLGVGLVGASALVISFIALMGMTLRGTLGG